MFNCFKKIPMGGGVSQNKQSLNSCFYSLIMVFLLASGAINIARADVCFLPDSEGCEMVPYEEYGGVQNPSYPRNCFATKEEAMSARTDSLDSYYQNGDMWCLKQSCSGYNVASMKPGLWDCQNCNDSQSLNYNKYKCSCDLVGANPKSGYTIDLERCEEKPNACPSYASTDCVPDECHECNSISSINPVYSGGKECLIYNTVDAHCPEGYVPDEPAGGCYSTQDMLCGEGKCYKATETPECGEGKRLAKANGVCSCVSECNANEYASENVCKQNADECLQNNENECWFGRKFVQLYYLYDYYRDPETGIREPGDFDECTKNEQLYVDGEACADNRCKAYIGQTISISYDTIDHPINEQCSHQYFLGKGIYENILDAIYDGVSDAVTPIDDSIVMSDENIDAYGLRDFVRTKSVDWVYEDEDKWLGIVKTEDLKETTFDKKVILSWTSPTRIGSLQENKPEFTEFNLWLDEIVDEGNKINNGWKISNDIKIEITYERKYYLQGDPNYANYNAHPDCPFHSSSKEFNYIPYSTQTCCKDYHRLKCTDYYYDENQYGDYVFDKVRNFNAEHGSGLASVDLNNKNEITVGITIPKDTIELYKDSNESLLLWSADYIPDFDNRKIKSIKYYVDGRVCSVDNNHGDLEASCIGIDSDIGNYKIYIKKK